MGVSIIDKDVTLVSGIGPTLKSAINNVMGSTGWLVTTTTTAAPIVVPSPTPNWPDVSGTAPYLDSSAQVIGITTSITLSIYVVSGTGGQFFVSTNTTNSFPGTGPTQITSSPTNITVNPNDYVIFRLATGPASRTVNIVNSSSGGTLLDGFTITLN